MKEEEKTPKDEDNEWETVSIFEEQGQSLQELMEELIRVVIKD